VTCLGQSSPAAKSALLFYLSALLHMCNTGHWDPINVSDRFDAAKRRNSQFESTKFKTWHFQVTSVLIPTQEIHDDINWLPTNKIIIMIADAKNLLAKTYFKAKVMNEARPAGVTFISWRFSSVDAKLWISNATAKRG
jgi:hypothetical protein